MEPAPYTKPFIISVMESNWSKGEGALASTELSRTGCVFREKEWAAAAGLRRRPGAPGGGKNL